MATSSTSSISSTFSSNSTSSTSHSSPPAAKPLPRLGIYRLPDVITLMIFDLLNVKEQALIMSVCKQWRTFLMEAPSELFYPYAAISNPRSVDDPLLINYAKSHKTKRAIALTIQHPQSELDLHTWESASHWVTATMDLNSELRLNRTQRMNISDEGLSALCRAFRISSFTLTHVGESLSERDITSRSISLLNPDILTNLDLRPDLKYRASGDSSRRRNPLFNEALLNFIASCKKLRTLSLFGPDVTSIALFHLSELTRLSLINCRTPEVDLNKLANQCPNLTNLELSHASVSDTTISLLALTELVELRLISCRHIRNLVPLTVNCPKLRLLDVTGSWITTEGFIKLSLSHLTSLNLRRCYDVTKDALMELASNYPSLGRLDLSSTGRRTGHIDNEIVSSLRLRNLTWLDVSYGMAGEIDDRGLISLFINCTLLQHVNVSGSSITNEGLGKCIATRLTSLSLNYCQNLTDECIKILNSNFPNLQTLELGNLPSITSVEGLSLKQLTSLNFRGCSITDEGLPGISIGCPRIRYLYLSNDITDKGIARLCLSKLLHIELGSNRQITYYGLKMLTKHCLKLRRVVLDATTLHRLSSRETEELPKSLELYRF